MQVRGEPRPFVELDLDHVVGRLGREGRKPGLVHHRPGADRPRAARLASIRSRRRSRTDTPARAAGAPCRTPRRSEASAGARGSPARTARCPGRCAGAASACMLMRPSSGSRESPHAVPHCSARASAIWLAPAVPRNCRVISQIEFQPRDMRLRQQAAGCVHRQRAAGLDAAVLHEGRRFARRRNSRSARARTAPAARTHRRCRSPARRRARRPA